MKPAALLLRILLILICSAPVTAQDRLILFVQAENLNAEVIAQELIKDWSTFVEPELQLPDPSQAELKTLYRVAVAISAESDGFKVQVDLIKTDGRSRSARLKLGLASRQSLVPAVNGTLRRLWLQEKGFPPEPPGRPPAYLTSFRLDSLAGMEKWQSKGQPLDCTVDADGLSLSFSKGRITLGPLFQMNPATVQILYSDAAWPENFTADRIFSIWGETLLLDANSGDLRIINRLSGESQVFQSGVERPTDAAVFPRGGLALLKKNSVTVLFRRRVDQHLELTKSEVALPPSLYTAVQADKKNRLWLYDLKERRLRVFTLTGEEVHSVTPLIPAATLTFPQIFALDSAGGFYLGGAGELWKFDSRGRPLYRLNTIHASYREALPAYFRIAAAGNGLYLFDPLSGRIHLFGDPAPGDPARPVISRIFARSLPQDPTERRALVKLCLEHDLLLLAYQLASALQQDKLSADIHRQTRGKAARLLAELGRDLEYRLLLEEAESALARSLDLYRRLRLEDPIDPDYPQAIEQLSAKRKTLRDLRFSEAELPLELSIPTSSTAEPSSGAPDSMPTLRLVLDNLQGKLTDLELITCWAAHPETRSSYFTDRLERGQTLSLPVTLDSPLLRSNEPGTLRFSVLIRYVNEKGRREEYQRFSVGIDGQQRIGRDLGIETIRRIDRIFTGS